jgi:hypothetical protein
MQREFPVLYKAASVSIATPIIGFAANILSPAWDFGTCDACNFSPAILAMCVEPDGGRGEAGSR